MISPSNAQLIPFISDGTTNTAIGYDALIYVMQHGHAIMVPTQALYFAEKLAVTTIAQPRKVKDQTPGEVHPAVLRDVNQAIDIITSSIRRREKLDQEDTQAAPAGSRHDDRPNDGPMARLEDRPLVRPPNGEKVKIEF